MDTTELMAAACPKIGSLGSAYYADPATRAVGKELELDTFGFYFLGRGGVLGDVPSRVVVSAFGYFERSLVAKMWDSGCEVVSPREAAEAHIECAHEFGQARFAGIAGLEAFCAAAGAVNDAADPAGLTLYAGISSYPLPDDPAARAMQLLATLRELRGSAHLVAVLASGLTPREAHALRRPENYTMFGWSEPAPEPTDERRAKLRAADELTDRLLEPAFGVLDDAGRAALLDGLDAMEKALKS